MKKIHSMIFFCVVALLIGAVACGGGKYADAKKVIAESNKIMEDFYEDIDKADSAEKFAAALNGFTKSMQPIVSEMKKLEEKYPELGDQGDVPEELGEEGKKMMELWMKFSSIMMKAQQYADDPAVAKAMEGLENIMK